MKSIFALSSVPLVMTLGNSMLIPVLPVIEKIKHFFVSGVVDHHGLFNCGDCMHPDYRLYVGPVRKKRSCSHAF